MTSKESPLDILSRAATMVTERKEEDNKKQNSNIKEEEEEKLKPVEPLKPLKKRLKYENKQDDNIPIDFSKSTGLLG